MQTVVAKILLFLLSLHHVNLQEATLYVREGEDNDKFLSHPTGKWSKMAYKILHHPVFYVFDLLLCIMLMLLALIERPAVFSGTPDDKPVVTVRHVHVVAWRICKRAHKERYSPVLCFLCALKMVS